MQWAFCKSCNLTATRYKLKASSRCRSSAPRSQGAGSSLLVPYEAVEVNEVYSIRLYSPRIVARTHYERRDEGFIRLGKYFDDAKLPQTQPILMTYPDEAKAPPCSTALLPLKAPQSHQTLALGRETRRWSCTSDLRR